MTTTIDPTPSAASLDPAATDPAAPDAATTDSGAPVVDGRSETLTDRHGRRARLLGLGALLVGTAVLYLWGLSASGYGNSFYSAAVQAGSESWKAFFYGSLDAGNAITVDKPPASLWLMALSVRLFGLSSWSILAPQALLGVATVGVLYASVRHTVTRSGPEGSPVAGHTAGLVAGALLALTPAAALMFRFNNPDALLVFLMTLAAYATLRAVEHASARWLVGAGVLIGFAFLTKMLQGFLVLPSFVLVYLLFAHTTIGKRVLHLLAAFAAMIVSAGWWVAIVELVPASARPYVGGSTDNSILDLVFGYNGLARILGRSGAAGAGAQAAGPGGAGGRGGGFGGPTGITRLFDSVSGGMISWLIPAALILGVVALVALRRSAPGTPRNSSLQAGVVLWAGWLVVTGLVFSFMAGTYHDYYTVALSPAVAGLTAVAGTALWQRRHTWLARTGLAVAMVASAGWASALLSQAPTPYSTLRWPVAIVGVVAAAGLLLAHRLGRVLASIVLGLAVAGAAAGPAAYALNTVATPHQGSIVTAGPVQATNGPGRRGFTRRDGGTGQAGTGRPGGQPGTGAPGTPGTAPQAGPGQGGGGFGGETSNNADLVALLESGGAGYRWAAATTGSASAAALQLPSEMPVMAIGGFSGGDASPTLAQFQSDVANGQIHYYVSGGNRGGPGGGRGPAAQIATWVADNFTASTVGGATVYDLTQSR